MSERTQTGYRLYWRTSDGDRAIRNEWKAGDQALCMSMNRAQVGATAQAANTYYWALVTEAGTEEAELPDGQVAECHYIDLSVQVCVPSHTDDGWEPSPDDEIVMLGHRPQEGEDEAEVKKRQCALYLAAYESLDTALRPPLIAYYEGIDDFDLPKHRTTYKDARGGTWTGDIKMVSSKTLADYLKELEDGINAVETKTTYMHRAYATALGGAAGTWVKEAAIVAGTAYKYIGICSNTTESDAALAYSDYAWSAWKGEDGQPGKDGKDGSNGKDGKDGSNGKDGKDGQGVEKYQIEVDGEAGGVQFGTGGDMVTIEDWNLPDFAGKYGPWPWIDEGTGARMMAVAYDLAARTVRGVWFEADDIDLVSDVGEALAATGDIVVAFVGRGLAIGDDQADYLNAHGADIRAGEGNFACILRDGWSRGQGYSAQSASGEAAVRATVVEGSILSNGAAGIDGKDGKDGSNGKDGKDGKDGTGVEKYTLEASVLGDGSDGAVKAGGWLALTSDHREELAPGEPRLLAVAWNLATDEVALEMADIDAYDVRALVDDCLAAPGDIVVALSMRGCAIDDDQADYLNAHGADIRAGEGNFACILRDGWSRGQGYSAQSASGEAAVRATVVEGAILSNGAAGTDGKDGKPGQAATTYYTWMAFARDASGNGFTKTPDESSRYVGFSYNQTSQEFTAADKGKFSWVLFRGADGTSFTPKGTVVAVADDERDLPEDRPDGSQFDTYTDQAIVIDEDELRTWIGQEWYITGDSVASVGDAYLCTADGCLWVWNGDEWKNFGHIQGADGKDATFIRLTPLSEGALVDAEGNMAISLQYQVERVEGATVTPLPALPDGYTVTAEYDTPPRTVGGSFLTAYALSVVMENNRLKVTANGTGYHDLGAQPTRVLTSLMNGSLVADREVAQIRYTSGSIFEKTDKAILAAVQAYDRATDTNMRSLIQQLATQIALAVTKNGLKAVGIDLDGENGVINMLASYFRLRNQSDTQVMGVNSDGDLELSGVVHASRLYRPLHRIRIDKNSNGAWQFAQIEDASGKVKVREDSDFGELMQMVATYWCSETDGYEHADVVIPHPGLCQGMDVEIFGSVWINNNEDKIHIYPIHIVCWNQPVATEEGGVDAGDQPLFHMEGATSAPGVVLSPRSAAADPTPYVRLHSVEISGAWRWEILSLQNGNRLAG